MLRHGAGGPFIASVLLACGSMGCGGLANLGNEPSDSGRMTDGGSGADAPSSCRTPGCDGSAGDSSRTDTGTTEGGDAPSGPLPHSVVLFGGDGPTFFTDTWEWDGTSWLERSVMGPPPRYRHAMAGLNGRVILFGGEGESGTLGDTWQWDGTSWTQLKIAGPNPRFGHQMTTNGNKIVLFGGSSDTQDFCDTWEFDGSHWTATGATLTQGLHCIGESIATLEGTVYLFGGVGAESDTWAYDGTAWTQVSTVGPVGRAWAAMATLSSTGDPPPPAYIVLFGGQVNANDILSDTWKWDGSTWTQLTASGLPGQPPPRWDPGIALDFTEPGLVLFGGAQGIPPGGWLGDTWIFGLSGKWKQAEVTGPPARQVYTMGSR